jgi:hypothetical protein
MHSFGMQNFLFRHAKLIFRHAIFFRHAKLFFGLCFFINVGMQIFFLGMQNLFSGIQFLFSDMRLIVTLGFLILLTKLTIQRTQAQVSAIKTC